MVDVYVVSAFSKDSAGGNKAGLVFDRPDLNTRKNGNCQRIGVR